MSKRLPYSNPYSVLRFTCSTTPRAPFCYILWNFFSLLWNTLIQFAQFKNIYIYIYIHIYIYIYNISIRYSRKKQKETIIDNMWTTALISSLLSRSHFSLIIYFKTNSHNIYTYNIYMSVYMCIYLCTWMCTYICIYIIYINICICIYIYKYIIYMIYVYMYIWAFFWGIASNCFRDCFRFLLFKENRWTFLSIGCIRLLHWVSKRF